MKRQAESGASGRRRKHYEGEPTEFLPRLAFHVDRKHRKFLNKLIARHLMQTPTESEVGVPGRLLLGGFRTVSRRYQTVQLETLEAFSGTTLRLAPGASFEAAAPQVPGEKARYAEGVYPPIAARVFEDAEGAPHSSALLASGRAFIPDLYMRHPDAIISDHRHLFWQSRDGAGLVFRTRPTQHESGIMLFGSGTFNWYHWLIETLPIAFLARRLPSEYEDYPLVIPEGIAGIATFRDSLELFRGGRDVIELGPGSHRFRRLLVIDDPVTEPMNLREGHWPDLPDYAYHPRILLEFRDAVFAELGVRADSQQDRIFLARGHGRRTYNQDELLAIAEGFGFRAVYPERLSFREQVETLAGASMVVGPSGAAFANTLFCQPGTRLLSWVIPQYRGFCSYANIARMVGSELRYLFVTPDRQINSSFDAFMAGYNVNPDDFEAALKAALESPDY
jgi:capsular polysaccharide biosynthesis protein